MILRLTKTAKTFYVYLDRRMKRLDRFDQFKSGEGMTLQLARLAAANMLKQSETYSPYITAMTLGEYIDLRYRQDRREIARPVTELTISRIKNEFPHLLGKKLRDIGNEDIDSWRRAKPTKEVTKKNSI